jgi:hypothetical protein
MKKLDNEKIKKLKEIQDLNNQIDDLTKKKEDMDFVIGYEKRIAQAVSAKKESDKKIKYLLSEKQKLESELDLALDVMNYKPKKINIRKKKYDKGQAIANTFWSDWHVEEEVKPEQVQFKNEFNLDVCKKRVVKLAQKTLNMLMIDKTSTKINKMVIYLGGDFISGYIHDDLQTTNLLTPAQAVVYAEELLYNNILFLLDNSELEEIEVICLCGNHSRYTKGKIQYKDQPQKTFEWIMYHSLASKFKDNPGIRFTIAHGINHVNYEFGYSINSLHGTDFIYNKGIGGPAVSINRTIAQNRDNYYLWVFGHLHGYEPSLNWMKNGSLIGFNQMAIAKGFPFQAPTQMYWLIHSDLGRICDRPIYL